MIFIRTDRYDKYWMSSYTSWPPLFGVIIVQEQSQDGFYTIPRSQTLVFPFSLTDQSMGIQVDAGHTTFYGNQQGTIRGWASDVVNGRSLAADSNPGSSRINLLGDGYHWLFYDISINPESLRRPSDLPNPTQQQWIRSNTDYFMCFQNLENKDNGLYLRFTYLSL
jgi:hypothetical protein